MMGRVTEEEEEEEEGSGEEEYFVWSADVSESESCSLAGGGTYADDSASSPASSSFSLSAVCAATAAVSKLAIPGVAERDAVVCKPERREIDISEVEMMKERFAKLLLGEDMSGGGKGVCSALAISNAITNLSATVFGKQWRLEPLAPQKKSMWQREMECLLCVSDYIVELNPTLQDFPGGGTYEIMVSQPRSDLYINLPALKKLEAMLLGVLDGFQETEFWYVDRGILYADSEEMGSYHPSSSSHGRPSVRQEDKWWLPCPCVPPKGLSDETRKRMLHCRDCVHQILKAAIAINNSVLTEMEIPDAYYESLPKSGKVCVGDIIYRYIKAEQFSPEYLLDYLDLSSEHQILEIANQVEGAVHVWNKKDRKIHPNRKKSGKPSWTGKVKGLVGDAEKSQLLAHRAECLLQSLKIRYPGLPQTLLDMNKIQYNKDVGQSILESYSRVMESLAFNIMARIDDVIYVDNATRSCAVESVSLFSRGGFGGLPLQKKMSPSLFLMQNSPYSSPFPKPAFCSSPVTRPKISQHELGKGNLLVKENRTEVERVWSCAGSLNTRRDVGDTPEQD